MINKFPGFCSKEQSDKIYELLNNKPRVDTLGGVYSVGDIFKYLPHEITYNEHRGDLAVTICDISYFAVNSDWKHVLVHFEPIPINGDIFDAFILMLGWLKRNNLLNEKN